jgi:hypothetical protein
MLAVRIFSLALESRPMSNNSAQRFLLPATVLLLSLSISTALAQDKATAAQRIAGTELIPRDGSNGSRGVAGFLIGGSGEELSKLHRLPTPR